MAALRWFVVAALATAAASARAETAVTGSIVGESRSYLGAAQFPQQTSAQLEALSAELKLTADGVLDGVDCTAAPYGRWDATEGRRSILDAHVAKCRLRRDAWSLSLGYDVEFWGVMEFVNPVDVLNQRDLQDDLVSKRRLGQPMAKVSFSTSWGTFDAYAVTWFTPLRFPGASGRLRAAIPILEDDARYGGDLGRLRPEVALRYTTSVDRLSIGASYYHGYDRDPVFAVEPGPGLAPHAVPVYALEHRAGLELQLTLGGGLVVKSEDVVRTDARGKGATHGAAVGLEYDLGALLGSRHSIAALLEYDHDSRARTLVAPFTDDLFAGVRFAVNDARSTEVTVWSNLQVSSGKSGLVVIDASTRVTDWLKASLAYRQIVGAAEPFQDIRKDSYVSAKLGAYF
jgi:hypothetical protein